MKIVVLAEEACRDEIKAKKTAAGIDIVFIEDLSEVSNYEDADAFFFLKEKIAGVDFNAFEAKPIVINSTVKTLKELSLPVNVSRINGWAGFLNREIWEIATTNEELIKNIFEKLQWKYIRVSDEPGFVAARTISMIINEAYFALGEQVSTKDEIDLAMKLGTNYPYGPFEWSEKIGLRNIFNLLDKLGITDKRYIVASALKKELNS